MRVKRSKFLFFTFEKDIIVDLSSVLNGDVSINEEQCLKLLSIPARKSFIINISDLKTLMAFSDTEWCVVENLPAELKSLTFKGGLICDENEEENTILSLYRNRELELMKSSWNKNSALYHFFNSWKDEYLPINDVYKDEIIEKNSRNPELFKKFTDAHGNPPNHFHKPSEIIDTITLPAVNQNNEFIETLLKRKTSRHLSNEKELQLSIFSSLLFYVYGCHGIMSVYDDIYGLKKTSPSGGGLHPTEIYPLIINVEGIESGIYHYNVESHSLNKIKSLTKAEAMKLADFYTAGQKYPQNANALFIYTSRFYRNFWKYRNHPRAYSVLQMDIAHLSQSFYLFCANNGLGAFYTAAINSENIENDLGINGFNEGVLAISGCGFIKDTNAYLDPNYDTFVPFQQ